MVARYIQLRVVSVVELLGHRLSPMARAELVLVAVGIYVCAVAVGKLQSVRGEAETPEMGSIETDGVEADAGARGD